MKRATKKSVFARISNNSLDLLESLQRATERVKQLEQENLELRRQLSKFKTTSAKSRQRERSLRGQLNAAKQEVAQLKKGLTYQKQQNKRLRQAEKAATAEVKRVKEIIKQITPKLSREQIFEIYKTSNQKRFWQRAIQVIEFTPEKLAEMQQKMNQWSSQKLRDFVRVAGLRSTWYDSDGEWNASEIAVWDERNLYAMIMSF